LALTLPTAASACLTQAYKNAVCRANQSSASCIAVKKESTCTGAVTGNTSLGGACIVGSCIAPKGKTANEWRTMSEAARQEYISRMPAADLRDFNTRLEGRGRAPG